MPGRTRPPSRSRSARTAWSTRRPAIAARNGDTLISTERVRDRRASEAMKKKNVRKMAVPEARPADARDRGRGIRRPCSAPSTTATNTYERAAPEDDLPRRWIETWAGKPPDDQQSLATTIMMAIARRRAAGRSRGVEHGRDGPVAKTLTRGPAVGLQHSGPARRPPREALESKASPPRTRRDRGRMATHRIAEVAGDGIVARRQMPEACARSRLRRSATACRSRSRSSTGAGDYYAKHGRMIRGLV